MSTYKNYPLLITRGVHVFPKCMSGMDVGRPFSLMAISHAFAQFNGDIILVSQMDAQKNDDLIDNIYEEGTLCHIDSTKDTRGILKIRLTGIEHVAISNVRLEGEADKEFYVCNATTRKVVLDCSIDEEKKLISELGAILATTPLENSIPRPILYKLQKGISSEELTDQLANYLPLDYSLLLSSSTVCSVAASSAGASVAVSSALSSFFRTALPKGVLAFLSAFSSCSCFSFSSIAARRANPRSRVSSKSSSSI